MKIKINKEQIAYLNSLESPEAKREFLLDQFVSQCELAIAVEKENLLKFDLPKQESLSKEQLKDITKPIDVDGVKHFFTTPYIVGYTPTRKLSKKYFFEEVEKMKRYCDINLLKDYQPLHPDKIKKYTKEDLERAFNESRRYRIEPPNPRDRFWRSFEEYLKNIQ